MIIDSQISLGKKITTEFSLEEIKSVPMLFRATKEFAKSLNNNMLNVFLESLSEEFKNSELSIDCRVHMLMPGWFPCIPGYHHDFVPRERTDGQPEYENASVRPKHAFMLINADICPTEFALGKSNFTEPTKHKIIYKEWHKEVVSKLKSNQLGLYKAQDKQIIYFDDRTWHQGTSATKSGWRFMIRASINSGIQPKNEIRNQVQVYMNNPMQGW